MARLNAMRFPQMHRAELRLLRSLRDKFVKEGGVLAASSSSSSKRKLFSRAASSVAFDASTSAHDVFDTSAALPSEDELGDGRLLSRNHKLCVTVLNASDMLSPGQVSSRGAGLTDVYCVVTYGEHSLRTDPVRVSPAGQRVPEQRQPRGRARDPRLWEPLPSPRPTLAARGAEGEDGEDDDDDFGEFVCTFPVGPLGLQFKRVGRSGSFVVQSVAADGAAARGHPRVVPGVRLIKVGDTRLSGAWTVGMLRSLIASAPRPLRLTFDDATSRGLRTVARELEREAVERCDACWLQQVNFDEADSVRARAQAESGRIGNELEHRRARIAVYARDPRQEPSLDLGAAADASGADARGGGDLAGVDAGREGGAGGGGQNGLERDLLVPLLYMFGEDVEMDAEVRASQESFGDCDILLGEASVMLPSRRAASDGADADVGGGGAAGFFKLDCPLALYGVTGAGSVRLEVGWTEVAANPAESIARVIDMRFAGFGISLVDTQVRKCELAYLSSGDVRLYHANHLDGREVTDAYVGRLQVDNQMFAAVHPLVFHAAPAMFPWVALEDHCKQDDGTVEQDALEFANQTERPPPAMLVTLIKRDVTSSASLTYVEYFDFYMQEVNVDLEERWLAALQDFAGSLDVDDGSDDRGSRGGRAAAAAAPNSHDADDGAALPRVSQMSRSGSSGGGSSSSQQAAADENIWQAFAVFNPMLWAENYINLSPDKQGESGAGGESRVLIERADIKPVKINLTFTMTSAQERKGQNRLKILHLMSSWPVLAVFASALINTVANITDAPLRFNALQIYNQGMSTTMLVHTFAQHMVSQLLGNLAQMGNLIASADLLGSPVQLLSSFGQGAYSFFYEPALALSLGGYLNIGSGLRKGGGELLRSTTHGVAFTLNKFAETASRAIALASLDARYIAQEARRRNDVVHEPINIVEGAVAGLSALGLGVGDGLTGVARLPVRGLRRHGARGLASGLGRGLIGVVIKPLVALFDAAALFLRGLSNTTQLLATPKLPARLRRLSGSGVSVQPYSAREAIGAHILHGFRLDKVLRYLYHEQAFVLVHRDLGRRRRGVVSLADVRGFKRKGRASSAKAGAGARSAAAASADCSSLQGSVRSGASNARVAAALEEAAALRDEAARTAVGPPAPPSFHFAADLDALGDPDDDEEEAEFTGQAAMLLVTDRAVLLMDVNSLETLWSMPVAALHVVTNGSSDVLITCGSSPVLIGSLAKCDSVLGGGRQPRVTPLQQPQSEASSSSSSSSCANGGGRSTEASGHDPYLDEDWGLMGYQVRCRSAQSAERLATVLEAIKDGDYHHCRTLALTWDQRNQEEAGLLALTDPVGALATSRAYQSDMMDVLGLVPDSDVQGFLARVEAKAADSCGTTVVSGPARLASAAGPAGAPGAPGAPGANIAAIAATAAGASVPGPGEVLVHGPGGAVAASSLPPSRRSVLASAVPSRAAFSYAPGSYVGGGVMDADALASRVLGMRLQRAVIVGRKWVTVAGTTACLYRVAVASAESGDCWITWRRYSQFRALRDNLMALMGKSRTALPIPSRRPWRLSGTSENQRQLGLNAMLKTLMDCTTLRDSPMVRQFFTADAEGVGAACWEELVKEMELVLCDKLDDNRPKIGDDLQ